MEGDETRVVYRCYATLYFVFVVSSEESELGILDLIQVGDMRLGRQSLFLAQLPHCPSPNELITTLVSA